MAAAVVAAAVAVMRIVAETSIRVAGPRVADPRAGMAAGRHAVGHLVVAAAVVVRIWTTKSRSEAGFHRITGRQNAKRAPMGALLHWDGGLLWTFGGEFPI